MRYAFLFLIVCCLGYSTVSAQYSLNDYKYVIVESQFHFQNEPNEYDLNRMVRFQFNKYGFEALIEGQTFPDDLKSDYCLALRSVVQCRGALRTKATIELYDCNNNLVYKSPEGITKEKDFKRAYDISIRRAFENFEDLGYSYKPKKKKESTEKEKLVIAEEEISALKEELKELKKKGDNPIEPPVPPTPTDVGNQDQEDSVGKALNETVGDVTESSEVEEKKAESYFSATKNKDNGWISLVHSLSGDEMLLIPTGQPDLYLVKDSNAIVTKKGKQWLISKMSEKGNTEEVLDIRF